MLSMGIFKVKKNYLVKGDLHSFIDANVWPAWL